MMWALSGDAFHGMTILLTVGPATQDWWSWGSPWLPPSWDCGLKKWQEVGVPSVHHDSLRGVGMPTPSLSLHPRCLAACFSILMGFQMVWDEWGPPEGYLDGGRDLRGLLMDRRQLTAGKLPRVRMEVWGDLSTFARSQRLAQSRQRQLAWM